jgi:hypothetical protein
MKKNIFRVIDLVILINLAVEVAYCAYMVFFVLRPEGVSGPLFAKALELPPNLVIMRRLYAIEHWMTFGITLGYLGIKEKIYGMKLWS